MGWRIAVGIFLILHGLIHPAVYGPPVTAQSGWDTRRSWVLTTVSVDTRRLVAIGLSVLTAAVYLVAGIALLAGAGWWGPAAIIASAISLVLLIGYFHPWLTVGVLIDIAIIWAALADWPE